MRTIHPLLDKQSQEKARLYEKEKRLLGFASLILSLVYLLVFYFSGMSSLLANLHIAHSIIGTFFVYMVTFYSAMMILGLPLAFFSGYIHEHKWDFSNHTVKSWLWEQIKSFFIGLIVFIFLSGLLLWIMAISPKWWWLVAALVMAFVSVVFATLFPIIIAPIFNKYTPIQNEELTAALDEILVRGGLKSSGIFMEDMSRQTKKENAFLAGLGKTRRIVLGDNLLKNMTIHEIESIIAHEVGHYKYRHIWKNIWIGTLQQLLIFIAIHFILKGAFPLFLSSTQENLSLFPLFAILLGGFSGFLFAPLNNYLSRSFEKEADRYSLANIKDNSPFLTAIAGLANRNLSNAYPEKWIKVMFYSHPPIGERLKMAEKKAIEQEELK
ncbi:MAG: M48 family metallopeptidase [Candidatus Aminicenantes bacterium]|nr:MAG: M48 family metallopeptidase [Candidatus Aminicenantes bacterium]